MQSNMLYLLNALAPTQRVTGKEHSGTRKHWNKLIVDSSGLFIHDLLKGATDPTAG